MFRYASLFLCLSLLAARAGAQPALLGHLDGTSYVSPTGAFKVEVPVTPELGGAISDTANVVTFRDNFSTYVTIGAFRQDATQRWLLETSGIRDYLKGFFEQYVLRDFAQAYKDVQLETNARFLPTVCDGAFVAYVMIPGGSMFADRIPVVAENQAPPVAKRGNMLFVKNGFIFVISIELVERVTEGSAYHKTADEEDILLRQRLVDLAAKMDFTKPPAAVK